MSPIGKSGYILKLPDTIRSAPHVAVITGANGGIGRQTAESLDAQGWATVLVDIHAEQSHVLDDLSQPSAYIPADITDEQTLCELGSLVEGDRQSFLAVAAAGAISVARVESLDLAEWERILRVNLTGTFLTLREMIPAARAAETGRLIAIASDAAKTGEAWLAHYAASKFGVLGLIQSLALELANEHITVNAICPSIVDTPMMQQLAEQMSQATGDPWEEWRRRFVAEIPAGRACQPADVAYMIQTLASPAAAFITGQGINVAGGHEMQ